MKHPFSLQRRNDRKHHHTFLILYPLLFFVLLTAWLPMRAQTDTIVLNKAVVTGSRIATDQRHQPMTVSVVTREQLTADFRSSVLPTLCEQVPGLFVTSRGLLGYGVSTGAAGTMKVRGVGGMAQMLVLVDGLPQYAGLYGHPIPDSYQTQMAEQVEVLRGPAGLIYGSNAMGGVMNIVTRKAAADGVEGQAQLSWGSYGTLKSEFATRFKAGRLSGVGGVNYGRTDGHRSNSEFEESSAFLKLGYELSDHWNLDAMGNLNWFAASNPGPVAAPLVDNDSRILRGIAGIGLTNHYDRTDGALRGYMSWGHHHINDGHTVAAPSQEKLYLHNDLQAGVSVYQSYRFFEGNAVTLGADWQHFGGHAWNRVIATGSETDLADRTEDDLAGYLDIRQDAADWLTLDAGARVDHHTQAGTEFVPQGGLIFHLPAEAELHATVSKGFRNPTLRELYMYPPQNAGLRPERLWNYELGYRQRFLHNRLKIGANLFYLEADNLITTAMINGRPRNVNTGEAQNWGFEIETGYRFSPYLEVNANYSFLHMKHAVEAAPEHKAFVEARYRNNRWGWGTSLQYVAGLHTVAAADRRLPPLEPHRLLSAHRTLATLCERRKPPGAALRNQRRIPPATGNRNGRIPRQLLRPNKNSFTSSYLKQDHRC